MESSTRADVTPARALVATAFAALYLIWGSTYLAILFALDTLPPFLMAGTRFLVAGAVLYAWARSRGAARPLAWQWRHSAVVGALMLAGGNGSVVWAEQGGRIASGTAALLVATVTLWMVLLNWCCWDRVRPSARTAAGVVMGMAGLVLLVGPGHELGGPRTDVIGAAVLVFGALCWALGSLYIRGAGRPDSALLAAGMQMLAGGAFLTIMGIGAGEAGRFDATAVSAGSALALLYLIVFGSIIGFTAYSWLLGVTSPAKVVTYAYVNPVVAMLLGWALVGEALSPRLLIAAAIILGAVALITTTPGIAGPAPLPADSREAAASGSASGSPPCPTGLPKQATRRNRDCTLRSG